MITSRFI